MNVTRSNEQKRSQYAAMVTDPMTCFEASDCSYKRKLREASAKFQAEMLLLAGDVVVIPTAEEWVGINLLERDGEI
jgi:hypothetical protein